jgi:hypothetical protein
VLDKHSDTKVLSKLKHEGPLDPAIAQILEVTLANDWVRIESWLKADPVVILKSRQIICSIYYSSINTFFVAVVYVSRPIYYMCLGWLI